MDKTRRTSAPTLLSSSSSSSSSSSIKSKLETIHPYRSLRLEKPRNRITKEPEVSIILEAANENDLIEDKLITTSLSLTSSLNENNNNNNNNNNLKKDILYSRSNSHTNSIKSGNGNMDEINEKQKNTHHHHHHHPEHHRLSRISNDSSGSRTNVKSSHNSNNNNNNHFVYVNKGYTGSTQNINRSTSTIQNSAVIREQYWSWSCPTKCCCRNWTTREKILIWIVTCLVLIICGLFIIVGFLIENHNGNNNNNGNKAESRTLYFWKL